ncbi:MAG TPA: glycosyltransferase family A protein [Flavobacteriaceae bacterium]|nr:glycosyltransferase family 2 protein [Flavobacteriaceae bacterium]MCB9213964.1 glycosyltransferase family 2 protein [Alteromonas sp.]HPF11877.1 glycosyltransferase family A protein [Flavobacteriaceae bacterium]HQU21154.1 glycosyltransferase family A protein [Flavobacteriaceae bacterium]HQU65354.1 glycosyltransferase family A protein [Flavobacteriaceae bacterium]
MPKFSVIIPLYNKENDIASTLKSLLEQGFDDFEAIVVDDGSTDNSKKAVANFTDPRIRFFSKENEGVALTRNFGVQKALGAFVAFLDADDNWHPHHLENLNNLTQQFKDARWFATAYAKRHHQNFTTPMLSPIMKKPKNWTGLVANYFEYSLTDALAWTSAVCFRKDFFQELKGFDPKITHGAGEDTDLWIRAALASPLAFSTIISATHNLDGSNRISHTPTLKRNYINVDVYEPYCPEVPFLKKYLDSNRFSMALQHKMAGDFDSFKRYASKIDPNNLLLKQRFTLGMPAWFLRLLWKFKKGMEALNVRLTLFK